MFAIILAFLATGILIGLTGRIPRAKLPKVHRIMMGSLFVMLFGLGAQIGGNSEILSQIPYLGWQSFVLALTTSGTCVFFLWLMEKFWPTQLDKKGDEKP